MGRRWLALSLTVLATASCSALAGPPAPQAILRYASVHHPVVGYGGMVVSQRAVASAIGAAVLRDGGNAVDAAVAVGFALAVALPRAGNLGGGGFMLVQMGDAATFALDFRERAPAAAHRDLFLDADGNVDQATYRDSHRAAGVPGTAAGLLHAHQRFGTKPLADLMQPAIALALEGVVVGYDLAAAIDARRDRLQRHDYTRQLLFQPDGSPYPVGARLRFPDLAATLERIAAAGASGFYGGRTAALIVAEMRRGGGLITAQDLADYRPVARPAIRGRFQHHDIVSMPPPSSGGVHLIQMLNVLDRFPLSAYGAGSADAAHVLAETMKRAYADRSRHLGDPDFHDVPVAWLTSQRYARALADDIDPHTARPAGDIAPGTPLAPESEDTTHYSVMDADGNAVAVTYTLNFSFGSGISVPGAGFLLNNEMADFSAKPGTPDAFGLITGSANAVAPGKRPLSAMTPTLVMRDGRVVMVTGSPGGSRIITAVLQNIVNVLAHGMNIADANHAPRLHHQWQPDTLRYERGVGADALVELARRGHPLQASPSMGSVQTIAWDGHRFYGAADPRRPGAAAVPAAHGPGPVGAARVLRRARTTIE